MALKRLTKIVIGAILLFAAQFAVAQNVNITGVDGGPYGPGSSIAVKITVDNTSGCLQKTNKFNLFLSDALGNFANETQIGTYDGFGANGTYASFVNGVLPQGTLPGVGYQLRIKTTAAVLVSAPSSAFTVGGLPGVSAAVTSAAIDPAFREVFGSCQGSDNKQFTFTNTSTAGSTTSATFYNDDIQAGVTNEGTVNFTTTSAFINFNAKASNYTVFVKSVNNGVVGTKAYLLINNVLNNNFGVTSAGPVCLGSDGATVSYNVDLVTTGGLQRNFPGTVYTINWGDGSSQDFTYCSILAAGAKLTHKYIQSSCGQRLNGSVTNRYQIVFTAKNPFCSTSVPINVSQAILMPPVNSMNAPTNACTNTVAIFANTSYPGQSVSTSSTTCTDASATYSWFVDGVQQASGLKLTDKFSYTFTTRGQHTVAVHLENSASGCIAPDATANICVSDAPKPQFTLSAHTICIPGTVTVADNSVIDNICSNAFVYTWTVTPSTGVTYVASTKNSAQPTFRFATQGKYAVQLQIASPGGACVAFTVADTVYANAAPQIALSPNFSTCGKNQTYRFGSEAGKTKVTASGTAQLLPDTYTWTVTAPAGAADAIFTAGTTATSQSPSISFPDFGTYTVTVLLKNGCGATATATQQITIQNAPTLNAGVDVTACANQPVSLNATVSDMTNISGAPTWSGGTASGFSDPRSYATTYLPTAAEVNAGSVTLTVTVQTTLQGECSTVTDQVVINLRPFNTITSAASRAICSGKPFSYPITSSIAGSTFTWVAAGSASASGYTRSGSGDINEAALVNTNATAEATVTYTIIPHANGCDGTPFNLVVSIVPLPVITATAAAATICSGQPVGITLTSNVANTSYAWVATSSNPATVSGFTSSATPASVTQIPDVLLNTGTTTATVTYVISSANATGECPGNTQTVTITIQPAPPTAIAGSDAALCNATTYQLKGNDLGPNGQGMWTLQSGQAGVTFDDATKNNATVIGLKASENYVFRWTSKGTLPCNDSYSEITVRNVLSSVKADFTADKTMSCDITSISFTNKSDPPSGLNYAWDFGNGITSTLMNPGVVTFIPQANGKDTVYTVKLTVSNSCSINTKTMTITIKPQKPVIQIAPDKTTGCIPFVVNVENLSPGTNDKYTYFLLDANNKIVSQFTRADKDPQQFTINTTGTYKVYMIGQSQCGTTTSQQYTLAVNPANIVPRLTINGNEGIGCGPLTVTFHNNTTGASAYRYEWGDGTAALSTNSTGDVTHTFATAGNFNVVLHTSNSCTLDLATAPVLIQVKTTPVLAFSVDNTNGCKSMRVQFSNTSTDASTSSTSDLKFDWDFGDGTPHSNAVNPVHIYGFNGSPFTVTVTATNGAGCSVTTTVADMIRVNQSSLTEFSVRPDSVIKIPDYHFAFTDITTGGPLSWHWDFGDGTTSNLRNPEHTYADTGRYKVTLTTANFYCDSTKAHYVQITGTPGQVYLPNAFMPNSATLALRSFLAKGSGLKEWHLQIFNNYGQLIFETSKLNEKGEPVDGWDGTFKGTPMPQGVYVWQATGKFINGNDWTGMSYKNAAPKRTGVIHLLR